jgi:multidrug efflux pump subunit AcrB
MTAFAFILGVVPLVIAKGAGAQGRKVMGISVFSGMVMATVVGVVLVPMLFVLVERIAGRGRGEKPRVADDDANAGKVVHG